MIDIEPQVFDEVCQEIWRTYPEMEVVNEIVMDVSTFPCVCIEEISNTVYRNGIDSGSVENYADVDYEVRVYVNNTFGKKRNARQIMSVVDNWFTAKGFIRRNNSFVQFDDGTKYQVISRYSGIVDHNETIYGR